jgi:voltage-gated potassium channel
MKPLKEVRTNFEQRGHRALLATLVLIIVASPFIQPFSGFQWLMAVFLTLVLLAAVRTVATKARQFPVAVVLAVLALLSQFGVLIDSSGWLQTLRYLSMLLFLFWVCGLLLRDIIVRSNNVNIELIFGAINVYLMVGLAFAFVYGFAEFVQPGSFTGLDSYAGNQGSVVQFIYFSYVTLSTLGYGDITPLTPLATTCSYVEAIFGQLYLAILVARLVGLHISNRS